MPSNTSKLRSSARQELFQISGFRFSVRDLLLVTTAAAIAMAILFSFNDWLASLIMIELAILMTTALTAAVIYGRGDVRAFCIGALFPAAILAVAAAFVIVNLVLGGESWSYVIQRSGSHAAGLKTASVVLWPLAAISGWLSVSIARHLSRQRDGE